MRERDINSSYFATHVYDPCFTRKMWRSEERQRCYSWTNAVSFRTPYRRTSDKPILLTNSLQGINDSMPLIGLAESITKQLILIVNLSLSRIFPSSHQRTDPTSSLKLPSEISG